jgi:hypothetical protein
MEGEGADIAIAVLDYLVAWGLGVYFGDISLWKTPR